MSVKVYLAGDISYRNRWRPKVMKACDDLPIEWLSPVDTIDYAPKKLLQANNNNMVFLDCDLVKVDKCDVVFAYLRSAQVCGSKHSGTSTEIGYAHKAGKIIVLVNDMPEDEGCKYAFIQRIAGRRFFKTLDEGIDFLREFVQEMGYLPTGEKE